jgi:sarcosine oxidase
VALVERSALARADGSSAGTARIYTPAAYPDDSYLEMGLRALERWRKIEARSDESLLCQTGALSHGAFAERELPALREAGVEAELISPADARRRFGVSVADGGPLLHQPDAGVIRADRARVALLRMARADGAELHEHEQVESIAEVGDSVEVHTVDGLWRCGSVIVAAGPRSAGLLAKAGIDLSLLASSQSVAYFSLEDPAARPTVLMEFEGEEPYACWDPQRGLKAALHARGPIVAPEHTQLRVDRRAIERVTDWVRARYPGVSAQPIDAETCLYTNTPDEQFILERRGRIVVACACNGQGFQFAPETGERLARLALEAAELSDERRVGAWL